MSDISNHRMIRKAAFFPKTTSRAKASDHSHPKSPLKTCYTETLISKEILLTLLEKHKIFEERDVAATLFIYWRYLCRLAKVSFKLV